MKAGRRKPGEATRTRLLDAAERLFADHGFDGVAIRDLAQEAGVALALSNYHFGTKEMLLEEVIARRAEFLAQRRAAALAEALADKGDHRAVLAAFVTPYLELSRAREPGWQNYCRLLAQMTVSPRWPPLQEKYFNPTARDFIAALRARLPGVDPEAVVRGFVFCVTLMVNVHVGGHRVAALLNGDVRADDVERAHATMLDFMSAGFARLAGVPDGEAAALPAGPRASRDGATGRRTPSA